MADAADVDPRALPPPARYFPVSPKPLRMQAGLARLGVDLGNGARDAERFQRDDRWAATVADKRRAPPERHAVHVPDAAAARAHDAALAWVRATLTDEHPELLALADADAGARGPWDAIARSVQEDFAVIDEGTDGAGRAVVLHVAFPSGWRPERLAGASFAAIHGPVPAFGKPDAAARSMVSAMIDRGPYVRFVWTLAADDALDHHPDAGRRVAWTEARAAWLRVERQVTIPLPEARASVFLIRTYLYPWQALSPGERAIVKQAIRVMPDEVRAYKSLPSADLFERVVGAD